MGSRFADLRSLLPLLGFALGTVCPAWAVPAVEAPQRGSEVRKVREPIKVREKYFSVTVPSGWSYHAGPRKESWLVMAPQSEIAGSPVHVEVQIRGLYGYTLESFRKKLMAKAKFGRKVSWVTWQDQRWLLVERRDQAHQVVRWMAYSVNHHLAFKASASAPLSKEGAYRADVMSALESVCEFPNGIPRKLASLDESQL